jgi:hypothetical protein
MRRVRATRYVTPLREGGSLPALMECDDDGLYVVKLRGAGQGPRALIAELIAGELARALGLRVPELVLVDLDPVLGRSEPDSEIAELIKASAGVNVGLDYLPGSIMFDPIASPRPSAAQASEIVWFDGLIANVDRTARNPNLLCWHGGLWLIDHGAALYFHHAWSDPLASARQPMASIRQHVLLADATELHSAHARLASRVSDADLEQIVASIPDDWLTGVHRQGYVDFLRTRLQAPQPFLEEAERGRA